MTLFFSRKIRAGGLFGVMLFAGILIFRTAGGEEPQRTADDLGAALAQLQTGDEEAKIQALLVLDQQGPRAAEPEKILAVVVKRLQDDSPRVRAQAVYFLGVMGSRALSTAGTIYPLLADKDVTVRRAALRALQAINPSPSEELPHVIPFLCQSDPQLRAEAMKLITDDGPEAVAPLIEALKNKTCTSAVCIALGEIGPRAAVAVPELRKVLAEDRRPEVRQEAVIALGAMGAAAAAAVPELQAILEQGDPTLVPGTLYALGRIGPAAKPAEKLLRKYMASPPGFEKVVAAWAVAKLDPQDHARVQAAVPILIEGLKSKQMRVRSAAARALFDLKPGPAVVQPLLKKAMEDADPETVNNLLDAVAGLGEPAVPRLIVFLENYPAARPKVATVLARIGPAAKEAAPALAKVVSTDKNPDARREALFALAAIGPGAAGQAPAISGVLKDEDPRMRALAAFALGRTGPAAVGAKAALERQLEDEEFPALAAAWALVQIDPRDAATCAKCVPHLTKALRNPEEKIRLEAIAALKKIGPGAKSAVEDLKQAAAKDPQEAVRQAAADALQAIEK